MDNSTAKNSPLALIFEFLLKCAYGMCRYSCCVSRLMTSKGPVHSAPTLPVKVFHLFRWPYTPMRLDLADWWIASPSLNRTTSITLNRVAFTFLLSLNFSIWWSDQLSPSHSNTLSDWISFSLHFFFSKFSSFVAVLVGLFIELFKLTTCAISWCNPKC